MIPNFLLRAMRHALSCPDEEMCGLITDKRGVGTLFVPCENIAENRKNTFKISQEAYLRAMRHGSVVGTFHSHPRSPRGCEPSAVDREASDASGLPSFIFSPPKQTICCYRPPAARNRPLLGRSHCWGIQDCLSLVCDFYERAGVSLRTPFHLPVDLCWENVRDLMAEQAIASDFQPLKRAESKRVGDLLVIASDRSAEPHYAVICDDDKILHQPEGRLSRREPFERLWRANVMQAFRPPALSRIDLDDHGTLHRSVGKRLGSRVFGHLR